MVTFRNVVAIAASWCWTDLARTRGRQIGGGHGRSDAAEADRCLRARVRARGLRGQHRSVLAPARCGWLVRSAARAHLRGHPRVPGAEAAARPLPLRARGARTGGTFCHRELV